MNAVPATSRIARVVSMTTPFIFARGEGCELITDDGARYLDFIAGYAVVSTGHCHPRVVAAAQEQMARLVHVSTVGATEENRAYAERLCAAVPIPDAKVYFTNSGTESTEGALKLARHATGRTGLLAFEGGFHGRTLGSLSITSSKSAYRAGHGPFVPGIAFAPYARDDLDATLAGIARIFAHQLPAEEVAAIVVESHLGEGGYAPPHPGFLPALRELCDRHDILLVCDEVQAGFGRTGRMFAFEHSGVTPDLVTLGKGIASGFPMGALVGRGELLDSWPPGAHGNTFGGSPLACAIAGATLEVIQEEELIENAARRGEELVDGIRRILAGRPELVREVRGRGLMIGIEMAEPELAGALLGALLERGVIACQCGPGGGVVRLSPPLVVGDAEIARFLEALAGAAAAL